MITGEPLDQTDGLVIVTNDEVLDVDRDRVEPITGLPDHADGTVASQIEVAGEVVAWVDCPMCDDRVGPEVFVVRDGSAGPKLADGWPSPGVDGIWVTRRGDTSCGIAKIALDGSILRRSREGDCDLTVIEETSLGVVAARDDTGVVLDPATFDETELPGRVIAVFEDRVLVERQSDAAVVNPATGTSTPVNLPESDGRLGYGLVSPDERFTLVMFGNPAWPGPRQLLDLWLIDTATLKWSQLPGMPVAAALKSLAIDWTADGRVVMLGAFDGVGNAIVTWAPTDDHFQLRTTNVRSTSIVAMSKVAG